MVIDIICVIATLFGFYLGFSRGIIQTVFTALSLSLGLIAAFKFAPIASDFLESITNYQNPLMLLAGFLFSFVIVIVILRTIGKGLEGILKTANINFLNQIFGGALLAGLTILMTSVLIKFTDQAHLIDKKTKLESISYPYLQEFPAQAGLIIGKVRPVFNDFWNQSLDMMDKLQEMGVEKAESAPDVFDIDDEDKGGKPKNKPSGKEEALR